MDRRLRVAMVNSDRGIAPGSTKGAALHLRGVATGLRSLGHQVTLFSRRSAGGPFPCQVRPLEEMVDGAATSADLVYERYSLGHLDGMAAAKLASVPFVLEVNAPLVEEAVAYRPETVAGGDIEAELRLLSAADLVVTVSSALTGWAKQVRSGPVVTVPNGFEPSWFEAGTDLGQTEPGWDLVFCGHPKPWHGADRLVPLVESLAERGHAATLIVIGGGPGADEVRRAATATGLADRVMVTGPVPPEEAARLLATARVGLAPYPPIEPFYFCPLKIVDYLAAGLAVVATDQGDIRRLTAGNALLVDPADGTGLVDAVHHLLSSEGERVRRGRAGRRHAEATLTWHAAVGRTLAAVNPLIDTERKAVVR